MVQRERFFQTAVLVQNGDDLLVPHPLFPDSSVDDRHQLPDLRRQAATRDVRYQLA
jgi:hypothetical protein